MDSEREGLAVVLSILTLPPYIEGIHFTIRSDHNPFPLLMNMDYRNGGLMRRRLQLSPLDFSIIHWPGRKNQVPDAISRIRSWKTLMYYQRSSNRFKNDTDVFCSLRTSMICRQRAAPTRPNQIDKDGFNEDEVDDFDDNNRENKRR